jgi:hypothetical protein
VWVNQGGGMTVPAAARRELSLDTPGHWRLLGSPELGLALFVGPRRSAADTLQFLLAADPG